MAVTLKPKTEITVPKSIRRKAGIKPGDRLEFKVSGRVIQIVPKLSADELEDARELADPKVRAIIREGYQDFLAGRSRPAKALLAELNRKAEPKRPKRHVAK